MPLKGERLSDDQIALLRAWIDQGADYPDSASVAITEAKDHWAFNAPKRPELPADGHPIDAFILDRLKKKD